MTNSENAKTVTDSVFGVLVHDGMNGWRGFETNEIDCVPGNIEIELEGSSDEEITDAQKNAYVAYTKKRKDHLISLYKMLYTSFLRDPEKAKQVVEEDPNMKVSIATPKTLFIDREGNYGWICHTRWDNSYIAILLSEEKPSWMSPRELRSYASAEKKVDKVFGVMFKVLSTWQKTDIFLIGEDEFYTTSVTVETYEEDIKDEQRAIYLDYMKHQSEFEEKLKEELLDYYLNNYDYIAKYSRIPETLDKDHVSLDNVLQLLQYDSLIVHMDGRIAWSCESFIEQNGIAFEWVDGKVKMIVPFSDYMYS